MFEKLLAITKKIIPRCVIVCKDFFRDFFASAKKPRERKQPQGTALAREVPWVSSWGFFGLCAFKAQRLHTLADIQNDPPMSVSRSTGGSFLFVAFLRSIITDACVSL